MSEVSVFICPRCQQVCSRALYSGDYQHVCQGEEVLKNESVIVIGAWVDYTGSDLSVRNALMQGTTNKLQGTRAGLEGAKEESRDSRGYPVGRFRTRQHIEHLPAETFKVPHMSVDNPDFYEHERA